MKALTDKETIDLYIDYVNNFITLQGFANHYNIDIEEADLIVNYGRELNNKLAENK